MIDLHTHSTASDGSLTPRQILDLTRDTGIEAVALTDHDTIAGILEIKDIVPSYPVEFITGVEISCSPPPEFKSLGSIHMLGYGFSVYDCKLNDALARAAEARALEPMFERELFGRHIFLYENMDREQLAGLGELHTPSVADLFVATMKRGES